MTDKDHKSKKNREIPPTLDYDYRKKLKTKKMIYQCKSCENKTDSNAFYCLMCYSIVCDKCEKGFLFSNSDFINEIISYLKEVYNEKETIENELKKALSNVTVNYLKKVDDNEQNNTCKKCILNFINLLQSE